MKSILGWALSLTLCVGLAVGIFTMSSTPVQATETGETSTPTTQPTAPVASSQSDDANAASATLPLTGLPTEHSTWRPVAVSVNSTATRTMGLSKASVLYEVLAQGQETSWSVMYNHIWEMQKVGPIAPANDTLWQFAMPQNAILIQNGWNVYAQNLLNCYAYQPIDAKLEGLTAFQYDNGGDATLPNEKAWFVTNVEAYDALASYGISGEGESRPMFAFGENKTATSGATGIYIQYSTSAGTMLSYDATTTQWGMTTTATGAQVDATTGIPLAFDNVFVLKATASVKDDGYTREYDLSEGTGIYLTKGTWQPITWYKGDVTNELVFFDAEGEELIVNTGKSYIGMYGGFNGQMLNLVTDGGSLDATVFEIIK